MLEQAGIDNLELRQGNATDPSVAPESVDVVVMRHVLAHNRADEQHIVDRLAELVRRGGSVYVVDVDGTAVRLLDADPALADLHEKYLRFHEARGNDLMVGLRLAQLLAHAGLEVIAHEGRYSILGCSAWSPPAGMGRTRIYAGQVVHEREMIFPR